MGACCVASACQAPATLGASQPSTTPAGACLPSRACRHAEARPASCSAGACSSHAGRGGREARLTRSPDTEPPRVSGHGPPRTRRGTKVRWTPSMSEARTRQWHTAPPRESMEALPRTCRNMLFRAPRCSRSWALHLRPQGTKMCTATRPAAGKHGASPADLQHGASHGGRRVAPQGAHTPRIPRTCHAKAARAVPISFLPSNGGRRTASLDAVFTARHATGKKPPGGMRVCMCCSQRARALPENGGRDAPSNSPLQSSQDHARYSSN